MRTRKWLAAAVLVMLTGLMVPGTGLSHHGWSGYDEAKNMRIEGTVQDSTYGNPHGTLQLRTEQKTYLVILAPIARMQNRGLTADMIASGAKVSIEGYPNRTDSGEIRAERITVAGKVIPLR